MRQDKIIAACAGVAALLLPAASALASTSVSTPVPATAYYGSFKIGPLCGQKAGDYGRGVSELHGKIVMHVGDLVSWRVLVVQAPGLANGSFASFRLRHGSGIYLNVTTKGASLSKKPQTFGEYAGYGIGGCSGGLRPVYLTHIAKGAVVPTSEGWTADGKKLITAPVLDGHSGPGLNPDQMWE